MYFSLEGGGAIIVVSFAFCIVVATCSFASDSRVLDLLDEPEEDRMKN